VIDGATAAAGRINAAAGVLGESVRVVPWSEDCTRERAVQVAEEISRLKPAVVVGHLCAGAALAAAPIYARAGVLLIVPGVRHPGLTSVAAPSRLVLRLAGRDDRFAAETVRFIAASYPGAGVALVADRTRQARSLASAIEAELARQQVSLRYDERIESAQKSYDPVAGRVRASGAGVVVMPAQPIELGVLAASLRRAGVGAPLVGSDILAVPSVAPTAQQEGRRLVLMLPWTGSEEKADEVAETAGEPPGADRERRAARLRAQAAVEVWAAAARLAASAEPGKVAEAARATAASTAVGSIRFDEAGDAIVPSYVPHIWRDGAWRPIARAAP
jgi:branched-chain amino acid transport system substrate-binding protein